MEVQAFRWVACWRASLECSCGVVFKKTVDGKMHRRKDGTRFYMPTPRTIPKAEALEQLHKRLTPNAGHVKGVRTHTTSFGDDYPAHRRGHWVSVQTAVQFACKDCGFKTSWLSANDRGQDELEAHDCDSHRRAMQVASRQGS